MKIRPIKKDETILLTEFIYEAIFQKEDCKPIPRTMIQDPSIWIYIDRFGSYPDDHCLVAEADGYIVGAVWVRCIKAFGYLDDATPEFAISVYPQYRGKGIGTALMKEMLKRLKKDGYHNTSLAVQKDNYAVALYQKVGFKIYRETQQEYLMVCQLDTIAD